MWSWCKHSKDLKIEKKQSKIKRPVSIHSFIHYPTMELKLGFQTTNTEHIIPITLYYHTIITAIYRSCH